jgi:hypothetical protein
MITVWAMVVPPSPSYGATRRGIGISDWQWPITPAKPVLTEKGFRASDFELLLFDIATKWQMADRSWHVRRDGAGAGWIVANRQSIPPACVPGGTSHPAEANRVKVGQGSDGVERSKGTGGEITKRTQFFRKKANESA